MLRVADACHAAVGGRQPPTLGRTSGRLISPLRRPALRGVTVLVVATLLFGLLPRAAYGSFGGPTDINFVISSAQDS
jgi:hypothetical protein